MKVKISQLKKIARKALYYYGYSKKEVEVILEILMCAQLRGNNQGLVKLIGRGLPKNPKAGKIKIEKETKLSTLLNGRQNMGMIVLKKAMELGHWYSKRLVN
jgi:LDH2 family malate/lactate/ureidoglycolate dehydrogenase